MAFCVSVSPSVLSTSFCLLTSFLIYELFFCNFTQLYLSTGTHHVARPSDYLSDRKNLMQTESSHLHACHSSRNRRCKHCMANSSKADVDWQSKFCHMQNAKCKMPKSRPMPELSPRRIFVLFRRACHSQLRSLSVCAVACSTRFYQ